MSFMSKDRPPSRDSTSHTCPAGPPPPPLQEVRGRTVLLSSSSCPIGHGDPRLGSQVSAALRPLPARIPAGTIGVATEFKLDHRGIEMVSPILRLMPNSSWRSAVQGTCKSLEENYRVTADETCSTHIHMSIAGNYSTHQLKDRRGNEYARSNWIDNQHFGYARVSHVDAMAMLERCAKVEDVIELMNPQESRYFGWNFQAIKKYSTIEFRRGATSTTSAEVFRWVEIATSFLRASVEIQTGSDISRSCQGALMTPKGVGESRFLWEKFAGLKQNERLDPIPVGKLSPEKRKKWEKKIQLDLKSNSMLHNVAAAKSQGLI
ncbi:hypothetical protein GGR57DRAFT_491465 [Xylariaceae sp. FL1272]|nr:hypothetical protein GGR57DRAFT_491465 [Xylariaceae sp. FL1272]